LNILAECDTAVTRQEVFKFQIHPAINICFLTYFCCHS